MGIGGEQSSSESVERAQNNKGRWWRVNGDLRGLRMGSGGELGVSKSVERA